MTVLSDILDREVNVVKEVGAEKLHTAIHWFSQNKMNEYEFKK